MPESKPELRGLDLARAAREELAAYLFEWSQTNEAPGAANRILSEVVGALYALEVVPVEERAARLSVAIAKLDTGSALLPAELAGLLANVRARIVCGAATSMQSAPVTLRPGPLPSLTVEVDERSESNFFTGVDGSFADGGLFVATREPLPVGTKLSIEMRLPTAELEVLGEVAWIRAEPSCGMGVRLHQVDLSGVEPVLHVMTLREPMGR